MNNNINFHSTFFCDLNYISKILNLADKGHAYTKEEISEITGIPTGQSSGKVVPHIEYAKLMNLIDYQKENSMYLIKTTKLGKLIKDEDLNIQEKLTKWLCHYFLTSRIMGSVVWYTIFREIPLIYGRKIKKNLLTLELEKLLNKKVNLSPFNSTYTNETSLSSINIVDISNDDYEIIPHRFSHELLFLYAYTLLIEMENYDQSLNEINIDVVVNDLKWGGGFGWDKQLTLEILELLEEKRIIRINKQLNPLIIIKERNSEYYLNKIYSNLI